MLTNPKDVTMVAASCNVVPPRVLGVRRSWLQSDLVIPRWLYAAVLSGDVDARAASTERQSIIWALDHGALWIASDGCPTRPCREFDRRMVRYADWLLQLPPTVGDDSSYKTMVIGFPGAGDDRLRLVLYPTVSRVTADSAARGLEIGCLIDERCGTRSCRHCLARGEAAVPMIALRLSDARTGCYTANRADSETETPGLI